MEFKEHSLSLFNEFITGTKKIMLSDLVMIELRNASDEVKMKIAEVPNRFKIELKSTVKSFKLAETYIAEGALCNKCYNDALHIALATLHNADILASWNFKHIVNLNRIKLYNSINLRLGYRLIAILIKPHQVKDTSTPISV